MCLNHKIRLIKNDYIQEIPFEQLSFSLDGNQFSCVVSQNYNIADNDELLVVINHGQTLQLKVRVENYVEQGWVEIDTQFKLLTQYTTDAKVDLEGQPNTWFYFIDNNGRIQGGYYSSDEENEIYFPELNVFTSKIIYDKKYRQEEEIIVPIRYYIKNGYLNANNQNYYLAKDDNGEIALLQTLYEDSSESKNDYTVIVHNRERAKWRRLTKLTFDIPSNRVAPVDNVVCGKIESYVIIDEKEYIIKEEWSSASGDEVEPYIVRYIEIGDDILFEAENNGPYPDEFSWTFIYGGKEYYADFRYVPCERGAGEYLLVYIDTDYCHIDRSNYILNATRTSYATMSVYKDDVDSKTVEIDGMVYDVEKVEMLDFDGLKEVFFNYNITNNKTIPYIILSNGIKVFFSLENIEHREDASNTYKLIADNPNISSTDITFISEIYEKITVNGQVYLKKEGIEYAFQVPTKPTYKLTLVNFEEPNLYICKYNIDENTNLTKYRNAYTTSVHVDIAANFTKYIFTIPYQTYFKDKSSDIALQQIFRQDYMGIIDPIPYISIQQQINNMEIPIGLSTLHGTNLMQEIWTKQKFVEVNVEKAINPTIDMEKDIYYPMKNISVDDNEIELVDAEEVRFNIHLRTRNNNWNVKEDFLHSYAAMVDDNEVPDNSITEVKTTDDNGREITVKVDDEFTKTSWNIFDYYNDYVEKIKKLENLEETSNEKKKNDFNKYYPPSDLIGFFDFTDDEIFYQKNKVKKTFLRLSFFNSKNPKTQTLLGTSTVFLDSNTLFSKFTDLMNNPSSDIDYVSPKTWKGKSPYVSGSKEAVSASNSIPFTSFQADDKRMGSEIIINNKFDTNSSAEGFYTYIFREYSNNLHEVTIYMRAQLNHAGHGNVIDLIQPMKKNQEGSLQLLPLYEIPLQGWPLKDLYDLMYIPIKIKYDNTFKKYCWYLPQNLVNHEENKIIFNLFEIKIANYLDPTET